MANLKQAGAERLAKLSRRPDLPPWWQNVSYLLLLVFPIYLGVVALRAPVTTSGLSGAPATQPPVFAAPTPMPVPMPVPAPPAPPAPSVPPSGAGDAGGQDAGSEQPASEGPLPPPGAGDVVVATVQGGSVTVPLAAYEVARAAAAALFTGDFSRVPLASSAQVPSGLPRFQDPVLAVTLLEDSSGGRLVFSTPVDPDGPGPERSRPVTVTVVLEGGSWRLGSFGF